MPQLRAAQSELLQSRKREAADAPAPALSLGKHRYRETCHEKNIDPGNCSLRHLCGRNPSDARRCAAHRRWSGRRHARRWRRTNGRRHANGRSTVGRNANGCSVRRHANGTIWRHADGRSTFRWRAFQRRSRRRHAHGAGRRAYERRRDRTARQRHRSAHGSPNGRPAYGCATHGRITGRRRAWKQLARGKLAGQKLAQCRLASRRTAWSSSFQTVFRLCRIPGLLWGVCV